MIIVIIQDIDVMLCYWGDSYDCYWGDSYDCYLGDGYDDMLLGRQWKEVIRDGWVDEIGIGNGIGIGDRG